MDLRFHHATLIKELQNILLCIYLLSSPAFTLNEIPPEILSPAKKFTSNDNRYAKHLLLVTSMREWIFKMQLYS